MENYIKAIKKNKIEDSYYSKYREELLKYQKEYYNKHKIKSTNKTKPKQFKQTIKLEKKQIIINFDYDDLFVEF